MAADETEVQERMESEVRQVVAFVEETTGLRSRWNGSVRMVDVGTAALMSAIPFLARKDWSCGITLLETTTGDSRWRSLLHEVLHSVSVGMTEPDYRRLRLWEEGTVEALQRMYRPALLRHLGLDIVESRFTVVEAAWPYNHAMEALGRIAAERPEVSAREFLEQMLRTPPPDRPAFAFAWGRPAADFAHFKRAYAVASGILR